MDIRELVNPEFAARTASAPSRDFAKKPLPRSLRVLAVTGGVILLLGVFALQLIRSSQRNSVTWDEAHHLYSGYLSWKITDFGINPEVPPLVKMVAAYPLLNMPLNVPPLQNRFFKDEAFFGGRDFLFGNDFNDVLFRARMAASIFSFALALLVFAAARQMFSTTAAFIALALFVFDPNFLAHGALVTTDVASACTIFAAVYAFYRWRLAPSPARLILVGLAVGYALVAKDTGIMVVPIILVLAWLEWAFPDGLSRFGAIRADTRNQVLRRLIRGLPIVAAIAYVVLWGFYRFRYAARPRGLVMHPAFADYVTQLADHRMSGVLSFLSSLYLFPQSWLYGLADTKITADSYTSYFFGHVYPHGNLLYFPAAFAIKSTVPFLILFVLACVLIALRRLRSPREALYLSIPAILYFMVAATSNMNIGARHLLPIYPFLYVLGAGAAAMVISFDRRWLIAAAALCVWQAASAWYMYPSYMAFGNELWGGPSQVHLYLSDANVDWGQQLNDVRTYLASRGIQKGSTDAKAPCWFAYFPDGVVDPAAYGVSCRRLPTADTLWWQHDPRELPAEIDGPVLISDSDLAGIEFGEGALNPYESFRNLRPTAVIDYGVYIFDGHFAIPLAAGLNDAEQANQLLKAKRLPQALAAAQQAVALAPNLVNPQVALGDVYLAMRRPSDARVCYQRALTLAQTVEPELQTAWVPALRGKLADTTPVHPASRK
jgi:hypothetical protein